MNFNKDFIKSTDHFGEKTHQFGEKYFNSRTWHMSSFIYILFVTAVFYGFSIQILYILC